MIHLFKILIYFCLSQYLHSLAWKNNDKSKWTKLVAVFLFVSFSWKKEVSGIKKINKNCWKDLDKLV